MSEYDRASVPDFKKVDLSISMEGIMPRVTMGEPLSGKALRSMVGKMQQLETLKWFKDPKDVFSLRCAATLFASVPVIKHYRKQGEEIWGPEQVMCDGKKLYAYWVWPSDEWTGIEIGWAMDTPYWKPIMSLCDLCQQAELFTYYAGSLIETLKEYDLDSLSDNGGERTEEKPIYVEDWYAKKVNEVLGAAKHAVARAKRLKGQEGEELLKIIRSIKAVMRKYGKMDINLSAQMLTDREMSPIVWEFGDNELSTMTDSFINDIWGNETVVCDWSCLNSDGKMGHPTGAFAEKHALRNIVSQWMQKVKGSHLSRST